MGQKYTGVNILVEVAPVAAPLPGAALAVPADAAFKTLVGRSTGYNVDGNRFEFDAEFGDPNNFWRSGSVITDRGWTVPMEAYYKDTDDGHQIVEDAVFQKGMAGAAVSPYLYIRIYPLGKVDTAKFVHGFCTVDSQDDAYERAGSLDRSLQFTGEGELFRGRYDATP